MFQRDHPVDKKHLPSSETSPSSGSRCLWASSSPSVQSVVADPVAKAVVVVDVVNVPSVVVVDVVVGTERRRWSRQESRGRRRCRRRSERRRRRCCRRYKASSLMPFVVVVWNLLMKKVRLQWRSIAWSLQMTKRVIDWTLKITMKNDCLESPNDKKCHRLDSEDYNEKWLSGVSTRQKVSSTGLWRLQWKMIVWSLRTTKILILSNQKKKKRKSEIFFGKFGRYTCCFEPIQPGVPTTWAVTFLLGHRAPSKVSAVWRQPFSTKHLGSSKSGRTAGAKNVCSKKKCWMMRSKMNLLIHFLVET